MLSSFLSARQKGQTLRNLTLFQESDVSPTAVVSPYLNGMPNEAEAWIEVDSDSHGVH